MTKFALALAAAALSSSAIMFSPIAYAGTAQSAETHTKLSWQGLDLSTQAGQREFARRTDIAVRAACPDQAVTGSRLQDRATSECRASARAQIAQKVGAMGRLALRN